MMTASNVIDISYCATKGLLFSHMGWIFYKPKYEKMELINKDDLDSDPGNAMHCFHIQFPLRFLKW